MITDFDLTGLSLLCNLDDKIAALNREVRFIARTLARLRHRHHAALVFTSSKRNSDSHSQAQHLADLQQAFQQQYTNMLKRIFLSPFSPKKERSDDIESAPTTPTEEHMPSFLTPPIERPEVQQRSYTDDHPRSLTPGGRGVPARPRPLSMSHQLQSEPWNPIRRPSSLPNGSDLDTVTLIISENSQAVFDVPRKYVPDIASTRRPSFITIQPHRDSETGSVIEGIYLPKVTVADFSDFVAWTRTSCILQYPPRSGGPYYYLDSQIRRLIFALALGCTLNLPLYQKAAVAELHSLAHLLEWPEDYVNAIFAATALSDLGIHPARRLWVAIIAAKTCGHGKRKVRVGPREKGIERDDRIASGTFWKMYDAHCARSGGECRYPEVIDSFTSNR